VGQEATEVGTTVDLLPEDTIAPSHRNFVTHITKGTPLKLMFAHICLRKDSPDQGRCAPANCGYAPLNIITPASTIAAQFAIGTGVALANSSGHSRDSGLSSAREILHAIGGKDCGHPGKDVGLLEPSSASWVPLGRDEYSDI
jgi:TPP-dependent pyruvate/acetoin dehydrogenase alpha subunit